MGYEQRMILAALSAHQEVESVQYHIKNYLRKYKSLTPVNFNPMLDDLRQAKEALDQAHSLWEVVKDILANNPELRG